MQQIAAIPREAVLRNHAVDVLVAIDGPELRRSINAKLCHAGYRVRLAGSAAAATLLVREAVPDVMIVDLRMQEIDAFRFVAGIRDCETIPFFPAIFLTERADIAIRARGLGGACVLKPVQPNELLAALASIALHRTRSTTWTSRKFASQPHT